MKHLSSLFVNNKTSSLMVTEVNKMSSLMPNIESLYLGWCLIPSSAEHKMKLYRLAINDPIYNLSDRLVSSERFTLYLWCAIAAIKAVRIICISVRQYLDNV